MANAYESKLAGGTTPTGNATVGDVLATKTFSNADGVGLVGTMVNNGAVSVNLTAGQSYTVPEGYHNGLGTVTAPSASTLIKHDFTPTGQSTPTIGTNFDIGKTYLLWVSGGGTFTINGGTTNYRTTIGSTNVTYFEVEATATTISVSGGNFASAGCLGYID